MLMLMIVANKDVATVQPLEVMTHGDVDVDENHDHDVVHEILAIKVDAGFWSSVDVEPKLLGAKTLQQQK